MLALVMTAAWIGAPLARAQEMVWAKKLGGTGSENAYGVALDSSNNVYTVGTFQGMADLDPGPGTFEMTAIGNGDAFVSRLDSAGNFVWARQLSATGGVDTFGGVVLDSTDNIYTTGRFRGMADFDPGPGAFNLTTAGDQNDIFVSKLDSAGNFIWAKQMGGTANDTAVGVVIDSSDNLYTVGYFQGTADFDPGPGTVELIAAGGQEAFIVKLDSGGNFAWAKQLGGTSNDIAEGVALDGSNNVYTVGHFRDTADFDPGPGTFGLTAVGTTDVFISKLDSAGNFVWAKQLGGTQVDIGRGVALDSSGNVYTLGRFGGTADFDPGPGTFDLTATGSSSDVFISKLDSAGNFVWAKRLGGGGNDEAGGVTLDTSNNVYTVGYFTGGGDFDPGPGTFNLVAAGARDVFVSKLHSSGNFLAAVGLGGTQNERSGGVTLDGDNNVYAVGSFAVTADFDPGSDTLNLTSAGSDDAFVWRSGYSSMIVGSGALTMISFSPDSPSLLFDVVTGFVSDLQADGDFSQAICLGTFSGNPATDGSLPPLSDGHYYLARGLSCCTMHGYGDSKLMPDPRDDMDLASPCP